MSKHRLYSSTEHIKLLNEADESKILVSKSMIKPRIGAILSSQVKFVRLLSIQKLISPFHRLYYDYESLAIMGLICLHLHQAKHLNYNSPIM